MNLSSTEQIFKLIEEKKSILIIMSKNYNGDILSSSLAFALYLQKYGKKVILATENLDINKKYQFLPNINLITSQIIDPRKFTIKIKTSRIKAKELSYEPRDGEIEIYLTSETDDGFKASDVEIIENNVTFDLVLSIGAKSKNDLGKIYSDNAKFIDDKEIINIDFNSENEKFGTVNFINTEHRILSEMIFDIISFTKSELIDEEISTILLNGIIDKTNGFRSPNLPATTMSSVSNLIDLGANKDLVIENLFNNKTIDEVKLAAIIIQNTKYFDKNILFSTNIDLDEKFKIENIFNDIISQIKDADVFVIFNKKEDVVYAETITSCRYNALDITSDFRSIGNNEVAQFAIASPDMDKVTEIVLNKIKNRL